MSDIREVVQEVDASLSKLRRMVNDLEDVSREPDRLLITASVHLDVMSRALNEVVHALARR